MSDVCNISEWFIANKVLSLDYGMFVQSELCIIVNGVRFRLSFFSPISAVRLIASEVFVFPVHV